jgi:hypothetical protein
MKNIKEKQEENFLGGMECIILMKMVCVGLAT